MLGSRLYLPVVTALVLVGPSAATAQRYRPSSADPKGPELIAVYISASWCAGNRAPGLHEAIDTLKLMLQRRAQRAGRQFRAVGVALDWNADSGLAYLKEFGAFDELLVGMNWSNLGAERYIWADSGATPGIPQVLVYEQSVTEGNPRMIFGPSRVLKRVYAGDSIVTWVHRGAPIP